MRTYKLEVITPFTDIHTKEKYKAGKELNNINEERAFELFSSSYHLVKLISCEGIEDIESIKAENITLRNENEALKAENENLKLENDSLKEKDNSSTPEEESQNKKNK